MSWGEILLIVAACAFVVGVAVYTVIRRKKGKTSCDCCGDCSHCSACVSRPADSADPADPQKDTK